jgi:hypothetical protein
MLLPISYSDGTSFVEDDDNDDEEEGDKIS